MSSSRATTRLVAAVVLAACASLTTPDGSGLRITRLGVTLPNETAELLSVSGTLTNSGNRPLVSGGCLRPDIAIDSLGASGWIPLDILQSAELVQCIRAFTVEPGQTLAFETFFGRVHPATAFPKRVTLRLRVLPAPGSDAPAREFSLP